MEINIDAVQPYVLLPNVAVFKLLCKQLIMLKNLRYSKTILFIVVAYCFLIEYAMFQWFYYQFLYLT